jgi:hypothetical protein
MNDEQRAIESEAARMQVETGKVIYIHRAGAWLMDKIMREGSYWAYGDENICMTVDDAMEIPELRQVLSGNITTGCDVIISR